jgi:ABC-type dipeptide/oligopeptide/nickel transport system ATPase component
VAHRLSTIRNANLICVMSEGRMVEQGSHQELLKNPNGAYSQLVALQQSPATEGGNTLSQSPSGRNAKVSPPAALRTFPTLACNPSERVRHCTILVLLQVCSGCKAAV